MSVCKNKICGDVLAAFDKDLLNAFTPIPMSKRVPSPDITMFPVGYYINSMKRLFGAKTKFIMFCIRSCWHHLSEENNRSEPYQKATVRQAPYIAFTTEQSGMSNYGPPKEYANVPQVMIEKVYP
uniref:Uncharacterized protein n=1 Tax=Acrobeloides nanus TaxID=290746 RepID=A0A914C4F8_9BILA